MTTDTVDIRESLEFGGTLFRNERSMAEGILYEWVTAGGLNTAEDAIEAISDREGVLAEIWDDAREVVRDKWNYVVNDVRAAIVVDDEDHHFALATATR